MLGGRRFHTLNVMDDCTLAEALAIEVDTSISSKKSYTHTGQGD